MRLSWKRVMWASAAAVAVLGLPAAYRAGVTIAEREHERQRDGIFRIGADEVTPFNEVHISGDIDATVACGVEAGLEIGEHPDEAFVRQRNEGRLFVFARRLTTAERFTMVFTAQRRLIHIVMRGGARLTVPECAVGSSQVTVDIEGNSEIAMSGSTRDLNYYGASGSRLVEGPEGWLIVEMAFVDIVFGANAGLCGADEVTGSAAAGGSVRVREGIPVIGLSAGEIDRDCPALDGEGEGKGASGSPVAAAAALPEGA